LNIAPGASPAAQFGIHDLMSPAVRPDEAEWFERTKAQLIAEIGPRNAVERSLIGDIMRDRLRIYRLDRLDRRVLGEDEHGDGRQDSDDNIQAWLRYSRSARLTAQRSADSYMELIRAMQRDRELFPAKRRRRRRK
jgi:hypothetical protein